MNPVRRLRGVPRGLDPQFNLPRTALVLRYATPEAAPLVESISIAAPPPAVWAALPRSLARAFDHAFGRSLARALGARDRARDSDTLTVGAALPGFRVAAVSPGREIVLVGEHRFSKYALGFLVEPSDVGGTRLSAVTFATFPGRAGAVYRALVVAPFHRRVTLNILHAIARRAKRHAADHRQG